MKMTPTSKLFSFPNRTFALQVFPSSITFPAETIFLTEFLQHLLQQLFLLLQLLPQLWLISTFTLFLKILCDIQYYLLLLHTNRFSALSLGTPWKWWNDVSHLPVDPKGKLARAWATFYNRRHQLSNKFLCLCCQWRPLLCQTY